MYHIGKSTNSQQRIGHSPTLFIHCAIPFIRGIHHSLSTEISCCKGSYFFWYSNAYSTTLMLTFWKYTIAPSPLYFSLHKFAPVKEVAMQQTASHGKFYPTKAIKFSTNEFFFIQWLWMYIQRRRMYIQRLWMHIRRLWMHIRRRWIQFLNRLMFFLFLIRTFSPHAALSFSPLVSIRTVLSSAKSPSILFRTRTLFPK